MKKKINKSHVVVRNDKAKAQRVSKKLRILKDKDFNQKIFLAFFTNAFYGDFYGIE